ncbi:phosphatidylinositol-3-phosphatase SAC1-like isoform X2 [Branchiostoma floridae x Branchiostoma belcheri]
MAAYVYTSLKLHIDPEKFYVEALDSNELMIIDRVSYEITLVENKGQIPPSAITRTIFGIMGVVRLIASPYLIVITKVSKVGDIEHHPIWRVEDTQVIPYTRSVDHLNDQQKQANHDYLRMIEEVLRQNGYYFSSTYDLTHTQQRLNNTSAEFLTFPLYERADQRFVWNGHLLREFTSQPELHRFILPVLHGYVSVKHCHVNQRPFKLIVISRRCCYRAGVRYYMRGADFEGHTANYVETEQIMDYESSRGSFVQTRGSVPLHWSQRPNLKYKPTPIISTALKQQDGFQRHFDSQIVLYGRQVNVNLLDQKGFENKLVRAYEDAVQNSKSDNIRIESFDFHRECRALQWHRLSLLMDRLADDQAKMGYYLCRSDGSVARLQDAVFRTNCIDCLDRTNVVQSMLARRSLQSQLQEVGVLSLGERIDDHSAFEFIYKNLWADNADALAKQYAGTGALKTDYTRTGRRTILGLLMDGYNSAIRYMKNNFYDGFRQDAIDLFVGNYIVDEAECINKPCPLQQPRSVRYTVVTWIFPQLSWTGAGVGIAIARRARADWSLQLLYVLFWGMASLTTLAIVYYNGIEFVDKPKLTQAKAKRE